MLQNYRFYGAFKSVTLTNCNLKLIHKLLTYYPQAKNTYKLTIMNVLNNKQT